MAEVSRARAASYRILLEVERGKAHADDLLRGRRVTALDAVDRNLTTALVLGVLRWQLVLDAQIRQFLDKPNAKIDAEVRIALRLGALQLLTMDRIPARAAIDESVELAKEAGHRFASRMVNAVLRKLAQAVRAPLDAMAAYPTWMVERWTAQFGADAAQAICAYGQHAAEPAVRLTNAEAEKELVRVGVALQPGRLLTAAHRVTAGDAAGSEAFRAGQVRLQDEGSQLVAEIAGSGEAILDCCAAPGGKTLILAERNPAARVVACEASEARWQRLKDRLAVFGMRVECRLADASELREVDAFDLALVDAPCSGTGTLGRNPEIRHRLRVEDLARQAERQRAILRTALRAARPGGRVVYSTCSLEPEENEHVVAAVLAEQTARVMPMGARLAEMAHEGVLTADGADRLRGCVTREGYLRLLPGVAETDGFFVAVLEKARPA